MADVALDNGFPGFLFMGQDNVTLDERHRCPIPAKFVKRMHELFPDEKNNLTVFVSFSKLSQRCLVVYPKQFWMARCQELLTARNTPGTPPEVLKRINLIMGATSMETLDGQNRIKLNPKMTSQVGIRPAVKSEGQNKSSIIVVGGPDCLEIWEESEYDRAAAEVISNPNLVV